MFFHNVASIFAVSCVASVSTLVAHDKEQLLNWCLNATLHKNSPGKEDLLHDQCIPWKEKACCTPQTTKSIHESDMHNFNLNHCHNETGRNLSTECQKYFNRDNCFYECEPHIGLWVVKTNRRIATERFQNVPLCASDCNSWWEACKDDFTCAFNWPRNFQFKKGVNYCPEGSTCHPFSDIYKTEEAFCENVWDHSWKVTPDTEPCMKLWFEDPLNNPNAETAEYYINKKAETAMGHVTRSSMFLLLCTILVLVVSSML